MGSNLESIMIALARRSSLGWRSEAGIEIKMTQSTQDEIIRERSLIEKLTMHQDQILEESSSQVEEEGGCPEARQESRRHHHQKRSGCRRGLSNL
jgi:hypothetical protein